MLQRHLDLPQPAGEPLLLDSAAQEAQLVDLVLPALLAALLAAVRAALLPGPGGAQPSALHLALRLFDSLAARLLPRRVVVQQQLTGAAPSGKGCEVLRRLEEREERR